MGTATCSAYRGREADTGELIATSELIQRVSWLADLVTAMADNLLSQHWSETSLTILASGVDLEGKPLPSKAYTALRRLGWVSSSLDGAYVSDRIRRMAEELVGRALRLSLHRKAILDGIIATWPADPKRRTAQEWEALWEMLPAGVSKAEVRNRTRQVARFMTSEGRMPKGLCDLESQPRVGRTLPLAACDKQQVVFYRRSDDAAILDVRLPKIARPKTRQDWSETRIEISLPPTVVPNAILATPSMRVVDNRVAADMPWEITQLPSSPRNGHVLALGADWGVSCLLTASVGKLVTDGGRKRVVTDGRPLFFDPSGVVGKYHRLRKQSEHLHKKITHIEALCSNGKSSYLLEQKLAVLVAEREAVASRMSHLNHEIAWSAARWMIDQAVAVGASAIYIEGLGDMEAGGLGRTINARVSAQVRSQMFMAMRHMGAEAGIAVVEIPARGTSAKCPRCNHVLTHVQAPDNHRSGYHWAVCNHCHLSVDRDVSAAWRICARGLSSQDSTFRRKDGSLFVMKSRVSDAPVTFVKRSVRDKTIATKKSPHPASRRRRIPSLPGTPDSGSGSLGSKRPEGQVSQANSQTLYAYPKATNRHRPCGEPLGRGFHRGVYASPVYPYGDWGPQAHGTPTLRIA